jgi:hypothetical protein
VKEDWTAFAASSTVQELHNAIVGHIEKVAKDLAADFVETSSEDALSQNRTELASLGQGARLEVSEFTKAVAQAHPTVSQDFLATAVKAVIQLEKTKSGAALLQKLASLQVDDIDELDRLLAEWSVKDALRVLDEIDSRLSVIETIRRLSSDPQTDELHTLHPLILRSRWLFGAEFESQEYRSNVTLQTIARELFNINNAEFINERQRPDIVVLPDKTSCQLTGIEQIDPAEPTLAQMQHILLIELKRGGFELTRDEINQADGYVQDIANSRALTGSPYICAWVVGHKIAKNVGTEKKVGDAGGREYGRVRAATFDNLVVTANLRLMKMRDQLASRYTDISDDALLKRVFGQPVQGEMAFVVHDDAQAA